MKKSYTIKWWKPYDYPMNTKMLRRISGLILLLAGIAYLVAWHFEYDLPKYDLPSEIRTPGFLIGYVSVLVFCFWPIDDPYLGNSQEVNLLPDRSPSFQQSLVQQHVWASGPMEHQGTWVAQKDDGSWWMHVNGNWERYA